MARNGRHPRRKGPGGPARGRSGRVTAPPGRPTGGGVTFSTPTVDGMVDTVLRALRAMVTTEAEGRAIGIEVWADQLAASVYAPGSSPPEMHADLAAGLRSSSDPDAPAALAALATCLVGTEAAPLRDAHAEALAERGPDDGRDLGIGRATPIAAYEVSHVQGDGVSLLLDLDQPTSPHTVGVYVDHNLGGLAKDLLVGPRWSELQSSDGMLVEPGMKVTEIDPADLRARVEVALEMTAHTLDPPVSDDFTTLLGVVTRRLELLPDGGTVPVEEPLDEDDVDRMVEEFLASPEAADLSPGDRDEAAWLVELWIDHATTATIGGPHRVSPVLVEVFCADWYPRRVIADEATARAAPRVLPAWLRYAARVTGLADEWRDEAVAAVALWAPAMLDDPATHDDPDDGGPGVDD